MLATSRVDWVINTKTQAFVRYAFQNEDVFATVNQPYSRDLDVPTSARNQNIALNLIRNWSPRVGTESRLVYSRVIGVPERNGGNNRVAPQPPIPAFSVQNESVVLPSGTQSFGGPENFYQFFQTTTLARGHHTLKFGGQFVHLRDNRKVPIGQIGIATFSNIQGLVDGVLHRYEIALNPKEHFPGEFVDPPFGPPNFNRHFHYNEPALFLADTWRITPRLILTPGMRWEYFGVLHSPGTEHKLDANFYLGPGGSLIQQIATGRFLRTLDAPDSLRGRFYLPDYKNFAPRLGIAYDPFGNGKTVIRSGVGIFYDRRVGWELSRSSLNPPGYGLTTLTDITITPDLLRNQYSAFPDAAIQLIQFDSKPIATNLRTSYTVSWNMTIERQLSDSLVAGASYLGSSGNRLYSINDISRIGSGGLLDPSCITTRFAADGITALGPDYSNCSGLNPNVLSLVMRQNSGHSSYQAFQFRLDSRRLARWGAELGMNYTWSHSIDNRSFSGVQSVSDTGPGGYLDAFHPGLDRGSSDFDVRHRFAAHWIWEIPLGQHAQSWKRRYLLGGWELSGLLSYQTGQPFTIGDTGVPDFNINGLRTRPRLIGTPPRPQPLIADSVFPNNFLYLPVNQVYDPSGDCIANTTPFACEISVNGPFDGSLSRNTFRQPGLFYQDTAVLKNIPLHKEGVKLQFRAEFYDLFNHPNLYINFGTNDVNTSSFTRSDGQTVPGVTANFGDSRQVVLALKLTF